MNENDVYIECFYITHFHVRKFIARKCARQRNCHKKI